jgi:uncharacterized membrane protein affecting hemolysin expression
MPDLPVKKRRITMLSKVKYESNEGKVYDTQQEAMVASILELSGTYIDSWKFNSIVESFVKHAVLIDRKVYDEALSTSESNSNPETKSLDSPIRPTKDREDTLSGDCCPNHGTQQDSLD